jgi:hypothetical protein
MAVEGAHTNGVDELFNYKNRLMRDILTNETIVRLIDDGYVDGDDPKKYIYERVFPYEFVPDVTEHGKTFICCEVDIKEVLDKTFLVPVIYIWVFTHESKLRLPDGEGVRVDKITSGIVETLNGSRFYGLGELNFASALRFSPISHYQGRVLTFRTKDFNRLYPTGQEVPAKRYG